MKNTLNDLNNHLFAQLERLGDEDLAGEELEKELKRANSVAKVAAQLIHNGELAFKTIKHMDEYGYERGKAMPEMLEMKNGK